jgi:hypothetical protein
LAHLEKRTRQDQSGHDVGRDCQAEQLRALELPTELFAGVPRKVLHVYRQRAVVEEPYELRRHPVSLRLTLLAAFGVLRMQEITDSLVDLLC